MNKKLDLNNDPIKKLFFSFAIPSVFSMLLNAFYVIADGIFITRGVNSEALAAVNIGYPIINFTTAISLMFGIGGATLISIKSGDEEYKNRCFSHIIILNIILYGIVAAGVFGFTTPLLKAMGADDALLPKVVEYMYPCTFSVFFLMISISLNAVVRNDGAPKHAMKSMLLGAGINIVLDYFFIFKFGMGILGGAYATAIGQIFSALYLCKHFLRSTFRLNFKEFDLKLVGKILSIGSPSFILEFAVAVITVVMNVALMKSNGVLATSAYGIISYSFMFFRMLFTGLAQGIQPIVSYNYGKNNFSRIKEVFSFAHKVTFITALFSLVLVKFQAVNIVKIFNDEPGLVEMSSKGLFLYSVAMIFLGANFLNISYFQSVEKTVLSNVISISRSIVFMFIGLYILPQFWGLNGIWLTLPFADAMTFLFSFSHKLFSLKRAQKKPLHI